MKTRITRVVGTVLLLVALTALAGPAYASGNGKGNGAGNADAQAAVAQSSAPGKSADAPGHVKKEDQLAGGGASAVSAAGPKGPGHEKAESSAGVKPSNSTDHNVFATAGSNETKLYGNGQTAGQIAIKQGASPDTILYGPGNSQPHKVVRCAHSVHGKGGGPDVHALKNKGRTGCGSQPPSTSPKGDPTPTSMPTPGKLQQAGSPMRGSGAVKGSVTHDSQGGVLSSVASVGKGALPFTGFPLWSAALIAVALAGIGMALRRQAREVA